MIWNNFDLKHILNNEGEITSKTLQEHCFAEAEKALYRTLGCTIVYKGKKFVLSNLELYYGSAGDKAHDWWRATFPGVRGISKKHTAHQFKAGPRIYLKNEGYSNHNRMDLVVGPEGVAISFLIRNVWNESGKRLGKDYDGNPALIIREDAMFISPQDIGEEIELLDTHAEYVHSIDHVDKNRRFISTSGFSGFSDSFPDKLWNYRLRE
ncbi:MAG: hypothetical protein K9K67_11645 [Bacteriovoracaceae bacterium]|nr:hypothetical protein [Bacteriovoracaceae bacterium]